MVIPTVSNSVGYSSTGNLPGTASIKNEKLASDSSQSSEFAKEAEVGKSSEDVSVQDITKRTNEMNQMMAALNTDLRFSVHDKTQQLMVQMVDSIKNKVIKEFPPHEFLDMVAKIRDYVGMILDKKV